MYVVRGKDNETRGDTGRHEMMTLLQILVCGLLLGIAYEIGQYVGHRDAERMFRERQN